MSRILRLALNAELPLTCMSCGEVATHRVTRTFRAHGDSHRMKVPACESCCSELLAYPRYQRFGGLLVTGFLLTAVILFCLEWYGLVKLSLLGAVPAGLHFLYYHWRFERDCLGISKRFILLRVRSERFVRAREAALEPEKYVDWYERLRCEGHSKVEIAQLLEGQGHPTRDVYQWVAHSERRRRSYFRLYGLRRFMAGSAFTLAMLVGIWLFPPCFCFCSCGVGPMLGGMRQMVTGTGYRI